MAHELEVFSGAGGLTTGSTGSTVSFVSAREHAWHRLGTVLPEAFTAAQAMEHAHLGGWNVRKEPLQSVVVGADGVDTIEVPGRFATVRTNPHTGRPEALGVVGEQYRPIQNEQHCELLDTLVDQSGAHFETAGSLKGGRQVFVTMKMPDTMQVGGVDAVDTYLAACNSHDGSSAFRLLVTPVRVVCANTQAAAISRARSSFSIHHSSGATSHIHAAREALGLTFRHVEAFAAEAERMIQTAMTEAEFARLVEQVWPLTPAATPRVEANAGKRRLQLVQLFTDSPTNTAIRGTRWAGYQAITEYLDHVAPVAKTAARTAEAASAARAERVVSGTVTDVKVRAFDLLTV